MKFNFKKYLPLICKTLLIGLTEAYDLEEKGIDVRVRDTVHDQCYWARTILTDTIDIATGLYSSSGSDEGCYIGKEGD